MTETSDDIIILSDDDDDDVKVESVVTKRFKPSNNSHSSSTTPPIKHRTPILILTEPKSINYGIERGLKLKHIHGLKHFKTENKLMYLVEYELCDDYEFVPSDILHQYCNENLLIEYLENITQLTD